MKEIGYKEMRQNAFKLLDLTYVRQMHDTFKNKANKSTYQTLENGLPGIHVPFALLLLQLGFGSQKLEYVGKCSHETCNEQVGSEPQDVRYSVCDWKKLHATTWFDKNKKRFSQFVSVEQVLELVNKAYPLAAVSGKQEAPKMVDQSEAREMKLSRELEAERAKTRDLEARLNAQIARTQDLEIKLRDEIMKSRDLETKLNAEIAKALGLETRLNTEIIGSNAARIAELDAKIAELDEQLDRVHRDNFGSILGNSIHRDAVLEHMKTHTNLVIHKKTTKEQSQNEKADEHFRKLSEEEQRMLIKMLRAGADIQVKRNFNEDDENDDSQPSVFTEKRDNVVAIYENGVLCDVDVKAMQNRLV